MSAIDRRLLQLEQGNGDRQAPGYIMIRDHLDGPLTDADLRVLAAGRVRIRVSPDAWPPLTDAEKAGVVQWERDLIESRRRHENN